MKKKTGQDVGEWGLIIALVAVISMITWFTIADRLKEIGLGVTQKLEQVSQQ